MSRAARLLGLRAITELVVAGETRERAPTVYDITVDDADFAVRYEDDRAA